MTARIWRGVVRTGDADEYARYIRDTGFSEYGRTDGNRDAIKAFAGEDIEAAVLYPEDEKYLVGESTIAHYEVVDTV